MFKVDDVLHGEVLGEVFFTVAPGETEDVEGKFISYRELVAFHRRIMELLDFHQIDLFSDDVDHSLRLNRPPTIEEIKVIKPKRGQGSLGPYIIIKSDIEIIDGFIPAIIIGIKILTEQGLAALDGVSGVSFSAFGDLVEV
jgi:hypothetical protein